MVRNNKSMGEVKITIAPYNTCCPISGQLIKKGEPCLTDGLKYYLLDFDKKERKLKYIGKRNK
jgi:hypothetical protein